MGDMTMEDVMHPGANISDPAFPDAPRGWTRAIGEESAREDKLKLTDEHWDVVRALQAYYGQRRDTSHINIRDLSDALDEKFHKHGGSKYLFRLFPGGPIAQGCRLAGLDAPAGSVDKGFGSVA